MSGNHPMGTLQLLVLLTCLVSACHSSSLRGEPLDGEDDSADTAPDAGGDGLADGTDADGEICIIEFMGREIERSEFELCWGHPPCSPEDIDPGCPELMNCPGEPCVFGLPPYRCNYCHPSDTWFFASSSCESWGQWETRDSHCDEWP